MKVAFILFQFPKTQLSLTNYTIMNKVLIAAVLLSLISCDFQGSYTFKIKNETTKSIEVRFWNNDTYQLNNNDTSRVYKERVLILNGQDKIIRVIDAPLNSPAHDCLKMHGLTFFRELVFDTYINGVLLERQLWQPENWTYKKSSKWSAEYSLTITDELINLDD
jgi:hypothetical protein